MQFPDWDYENTYWTYWIHSVFTEETLKAYKYKSLKTYKFRDEGHV